ncbi:MAG: MinD/ParA family protein, partial [Spirochaetaceae bacterium]|nr:MinD/ParA family protein [Spirochaetaceae bacterium]
IVKGLLDIDADYIIVDLGGGSNFTVVDFFLISNSGLIVTTPQTTAIMNAYSFLKNYVFRFLQRAFAGDKNISVYLKKVLKERRPGEQKTVSNMIEDISKIDSEAGEKAEAFLEVLQPKLILNKMYGVEDVSLAEGLRDLCARNLSINIECLGTVMNENTVNRSINNQRPFILDNEENIFTDEIHRISQKIIQSSNYPEMPLELDYYSDSFELAHIEMENDLAALQGNSEEEPESDSYEVDKLLELIRIQQSKIQELQGTLRILSMNN